MHKRLVVAVDGCCLGRRKTGNETYIRGLLHGFETAPDPALELTVITTPAYTGPRSERFRWLEIPEQNFFQRNYWTIPRVLQRERPDLYHGVYWSRFWRAHPFVLTIHDMSFVAFPAGFRGHERWFFEQMIRRGARASRRIITISNFSKTEICRIWDIPPERISVVYEGLDPIFQPADSPGADLRATPYLLFVGNLHPRKNLGRLLEAFVMLKREKRIAEKLCVVGQGAWYSDQLFDGVRRHRMEQEVEFTGYVSQAELVRLYQQARALVFPSLYEGFGLPVIEAMGCGCPVVTSTTSALGEIARGAAVLVDPASVEEIAAGIWQVLASRQEQADLSARGLERARQFRWEKLAAETAAAYSAALAS